MRMSASKFLRFSFSTFPLRAHKPISLTPPQLLTNRFPISSLRFHRYSSSSAAIVDTVTGKDTDSSNIPPPLPQHPWPEWVIFVDRLKAKGYFEGHSSSTTTTTDDAAAVKDGQSVSVYTDMNLVKDGCLSFARDRYDVFKSLSVDDIQTVVECGCPNLLRKAVNSAKRLRAYAQLDEGDVCSACNLRGSCDRAYIIVKGSEAAPRTVDIVRILLFYALDPLVITGGERPPGRELVEASTRKLLTELIKLSETAPDPSLPKPASNSSYQKEQAVKPVNNDSLQNVEMKKGDWLCPECNFMNFSRNIKCLKCKAEGPKRIAVNDVEMKKGDWNCPQCGFMNFASNKNCLRCRETRPKRHPGEWDCPSCNFLNYRRNRVCLKCNCERPKQATTEYEEQIWRSPH